MARTRASTAKTATTAPRRSTRLQRKSAPADLFAPLDDPDRCIRKSTPKLGCITCGRALSCTAFPKAFTSKCAHDVTTCKPCTRTWIAIQLDHVTYDNISCPECPQRLSNADVKALATSAVYKRFDELERRGIAESIPGWRWCLAPGCRAGQVHQNSLKATVKLEDQYSANEIKDATDNEDICTCDECGAKACVPCDRPMHEGETCNEFKKRQDRMANDEQATLATIAQQCKQCPSCKRNIQKAGGCDYMTCSRCHIPFCWLCMLTYTEILKHGKHGAGCVYAQPGRMDPHAAHLGNNGNHGWNNGGNMNDAGWFGGQADQWF